MNKLHGIVLALITVGLVTTNDLARAAAVANNANAIPLTSILPKLQAIHEDAKTLLAKNSEIKVKIAVELQAQSEQPKSSVATGELARGPTRPADPKTMYKPSDKNAIDYHELGEFNRWVEVNLNYAVKNTQASIEALKEEAQSNGGNVDYSEQAIKDGIEGVKYWQSAVIFQDKTLKNEKFEVE